MNNQDAHDLITAEFKRFKSEKTTRAFRLQFADELIEQYFAESMGERLPAGTVLDRLGALILQDEMADKTPWKMQNTEYPMQSRHMLERRQRGERSLSAAVDIASDGASYRSQTRDDRRKYRQVFGF